MTNIIPQTVRIRVVIPDNGYDTECYLYHKLDAVLLQRLIDTSPPSEELMFPKQTYAEVVYGDICHDSLAVQQRKNLLYDASIASYKPMTVMLDRTYYRP